MLFKAIGIVLSALFIITFQINAASAGCGGGHGGFRHFKPYNNVALQQSRARKARAVAAAKRKKAIQQARIEKKATAKVAKAAPIEAEATKTTAVAKTESELNVAAVAETCTKFIAETGTTVTIECAKQ